MPSVTTQTKPTALKEISQAERRKSCMIQAISVKEKQGWERDGVSNVLVSAVLQGGHKNTTFQNC